MERKRNYRAGVYMRVYICVCKEYKREGRKERGRKGGRKKGREEVCVWVCVCVWGGGGIL